MPWRLCRILWLRRLLLHPSVCSCKSSSSVYSSRQTTVTNTKRVLHQCNAPHLFVEEVYLPHSFPNFATSTHWQWFVKFDKKNSTNSIHHRKFVEKTIYAHYNMLGTIAMHITICLGLLLTLSYPFFQHFRNKIPRLLYKLHISLNRSNVCHFYQTVL